MTDDTMQRDGDPPARKRRSDGERSRSAILREAAKLATVEGIGGLSIGRLAEAVGMSKSGLFAHFGSKEKLQLATMEAASDIFVEHVLEPALHAPTAIERIRQLCENYVRYIEGALFPGGCFFASVAAEMDTHPGPVRDVAMGFMARWLELLETTVREAQDEGAIDPELDPAQLAFEIEASLLLSNALFVMFPESRPTDRARRSLELRLAAAAPPRAAAHAGPASRDSG
jgi:AcrR family transcriptional regulator